MPRTWLVLFCCAYIWGSGHGANIMFYLGVSSYSHRIGIWPLTTALADKGHNVTFVSPYPAKVTHPGVQDIVPESLKTMLESWDELGSMYDWRAQGLLEDDWFRLTDYGYQACESLLTDDKFVKWVKTTKFDLVFIDSLTNECGYAFAQIHNAKMIVFQTSNPMQWLADPFGYPLEASSIPDIIYHYSIDKLGIYERAMGLFNPLYLNYIREERYFPKLEKLARETLDPEFPSMKDVEKNVSLTFVNHHFVEDFSRPLSPNMVPIPALQCAKKEKLGKLPKDLEDFLSKGKVHDFIFVSFGSYAEFDTFPNATKEIFINAFSNLNNVKVLWKTNMTPPPGLADHILISTWFPQQVLLADPRIKAFITHAGLYGIQETLCYSGPPFIAFPMFAEQDYNAEKITWKKLGVHLEITTVSQEELEKAIAEVLTNDVYRKNIKKISTLFNDNPTSSLDKAMWWTDYVLRHTTEELRALQPRSVHLPWWKKRNLDVWAIVFFTPVILAILLVVLLKTFLNFFFSKSKPTKVKKS